MNKYSVGKGVTSSSVDRFLKSQYSDELDTSDTNNSGSQIVAEDGTIFILDATGDIKESSKPTVKGQFKKNMLWRYGKPVATVLHLNNKEDLDYYNNIIAGASGEDPSFYIIEVVREFWNGEFILLLTWCPVLYAALMRKTK